MTHQRQGCLRSHEHVKRFMSDVNQHRVIRCPVLIKRSNNYFKQSILLFNLFITIYCYCNWMCFNVKSSYRMLVALATWLLLTDFHGKRICLLFF